MIYTVVNNCQTKENLSAMRAQIYPFENGKTVIFKFVVANKYFVKYKLYHSFCHTVQYTQPIEILTLFKFKRTTNLVLNLKSELGKIRFIDGIENGKKDS